MPGEPLTAGPVIVVHLEDPTGSGLAACCGLPFHNTSEWPKVDRVLCEGCKRRAALPPVAPDRPPVPWTTINMDVQKYGLFDVVNRALIGKFTESRRKLLVGNIVSAIAKWRQEFRDCGCRKNDAGFSLCDWHERLFRPQREEAERLAATLDAARAGDEGLNVERLAKALDFANPFPWPASLTTAEFAHVVARAYHSDHEPVLLCTYRGCGKPESDPIHPGPDERMGGGKHVYRFEPNDDALRATDKEAE